jgi:arginase
MTRSITLIGAPSNIGIRPYDHGLPRRVDRAPATLRELGLPSRLGARDLGDVRSAPYRDFTRPPARVRNEAEVREYSLALAERIESTVATGSFALVLGGDCSIVLGAVLGARGAVGGEVGLGYVDGHADFGTPQESRTGSAASMALGLVVGRGETPLARLHARGPLADARHVALVGRRDLGEHWYGHEALARSSVLDMPDRVLRALGPAAAVETLLERLAAPALAGFWLHLDTDVLDPGIMPAVDSPLPGGQGLSELAELLGPLVRHPAALGMDVTIYDPDLDADRSAGTNLTTLLERVLAPLSRAGPP